MRKSVLLFLSINILFILAGCQKDITEQMGIDNSIPEVVETTPYTGQYNVSKFIKIKITLSESIDSESVSESLINIIPSINYNYKVNGNSIIITPVGGLTAGQKYWVTVKKGIKDKAGNETGSDYTFSFRTAGQAHSQAEVTLLVDNSSGKNYKQPYISGSWDIFGDYDDNWNQGQRYLMYDDGLHNDENASDGIWGYVINLTADAYHTYKWAVDDDSDADNGYLKDKSFVLTTASPVKSTLYLYPPITVTFNYYDTENKVSDIYIRGDFNDWSMGDKLIGPTGSSRLFTITKTISEGTYNYKYYADGDWEKVNKDNRSITVVYGADNTQNDYFAGGKEIVFNYYDVENKVTDSIYLKGDFNGWGDDNKMSGPAGANRKFTTTVSAVVGSTYSYKYLVDGSWDKVNSDNRSVEITAGMESKDDYYSGPLQVTFNYYDFENKIDTSIHIRGDFNGWGLSYEYELSCVDASSNKYSLTLELNQGTYNYKYYVDGDWEKVNTANRTVTVSPTNSSIVKDYYQN